MSCKNNTQRTVSKFPKISCGTENPYSCAVLPISLGVRLDTTDLVTLYGFTTKDVLSNDDWIADNITLPGGTASGTACKNVSDSVDLPGGNVVSFIKAAVSAWDDRTNCDRPDCDVWVKSPTKCTLNGGTTGSITLDSGAVSYANAPIQSISMPTFVPRAGGSKKTEVVENISASSSFFIGRLINTDDVELYYTSSQGRLVASGITVKARELS